MKDGKEKKQPSLIKKKEEESLNPYLPHLEGLHRVSEVAGPINAFFQKRVLLNWQLALFVLTFLI